ncbi:MAG: HAMP domain-containing histidine kinase [Gemmatimonadetes bacterium]|nr:HAMP domain-containing histidine kinase [Gemmatimonadota bacterium]
MREAVRVIAEESERLEEMARSFAQLGRMPEGPRTEIDLGALLADLAAAHASGRARVEVVVPPDLPRIYGQYDALSRVFRNLLVNALDATEGQARAEVRVWAERRNTTVSIHVADSGPGIDPGVVDRIWEPDFTTKSRGTGLGLVLVRQAVRAHGGDVVARNRPEGGAEFIVHLPLGLDATTPGLNT